MKFNYENPNQTAQAKVEVLRRVVHHYRDVSDLPWKYNPGDPNQIDRAEVETLSALVGLFIGDGLPGYLEPKAPEPVDENPDNGDPQEPEEAVENLKNKPVPEGEGIMVGDRPATDEEIASMKVGPDGKIAPPVTEPDDSEAFEDLKEKLEEAEEKLEEEKE